MRGSVHGFQGSQRPWLTRACAAIASTCGETLSDITMVDEAVMNVNQLLRWLKRYGVFHGALGEML